MREGMRGPPKGAAERRPGKRGLGQERSGPARTAARFPPLRKAAPGTAEQAPRWPGTPASCRRPPPRAAMRPEETRPAPLPVRQRFGSPPCLHCKQYNFSFYLSNPPLSTNSCVPSRCLAPGRPIVLSDDRRRNFRPGRIFSGPSEGRHVVLPVGPGNVYRRRQDAGGREHLPGSALLRERNPDGQAAVGGQAPRDGDQPHRDPCPLEPLLGRQDLVGAPEDQDHLGQRRARHASSLAERG